MSIELKDPQFHARLSAIIGKESPFAWAERIGIPKGTFHRVWNEGTVPGPDHLRRIAEKTGITIDWLLTGDGPMKREDKGGLHINGDKNVQVNGGVVHAVHTVFAKEAREAGAPQPNLSSAPPPAAALDPLDAAYLDDWHKLSEVGKMRVWTIVKEEIEKEKAVKE